MTLEPLELIEVVALALHVSAAWGSCRVFLESQLAVKSLDVRIAAF